MPLRPGQLPPRGRKWTSREDNIIRQVYPKQGTPGCLARIHAYPEFRDRTTEGIRHRATRLGVYYNPYGRGSDELMNLVDAQRNVHVCNGQSRAQASREIVRAAEEAGVVVRSEVYPHARMAPVWWVEQYMQRLDERIDDERSVTRSWLRTPEVAELFGVKPGSIKTMRSPSNPKRYAVVEHFDRIPTRRLMSHHTTNGRPGLYWHPEAARREARLWAVRRQRNRVERRHTKKQAIGGG